MLAGLYGFLRYCMLLAKSLTFISLNLHEYIMCTLCGFDNSFIYICNLLNQNLFLVDSNCEASQWRVCHQQGLPRLVLEVFKKYAFHTLIKGSCYFCVSLGQFINRTGVAGAVLQTALFINYNNCKCTPNVYSLKLHYIKLHLTM